MNLEMVNWLAWGGLILGLASRVFLPWLAARRKDPLLSWQWSYFWPQLLSFVLIVMVLPLVISEMETVNNMPIQMAWLAGWGAADLGRQVVKAFEDNGEDADI